MPMNAFAINAGGTRSRNASGTSRLPEIEVLENVAASAMHRSTSSRRLIDPHAERLVEEHRRLVARAGQEARGVAEPLLADGIELLGCLRSPHG